MITPPLSSVIGPDYVPEHMTEPQIRKAIIALEGKLRVEAITHENVVCLLRLRLALNNFHEARELMWKQIVE